jgi:CRP-like cAMP-binding protein
MTLIDQISKLTDLCDEAVVFLNQKSEQLSFLKNEVLLGFEENCHYLYFVDKGFLRGYYYLDAKEITTWFSQEGEFATCFYAFISRKPSVESIQAIEDTTVTRISYEALQEVYRLFPETERVGRLITEAYYLKLEERFLSIQFKSAKERYQHLLDTKPSLLHRAALGQIASYLGISQETLSRMRADL